MPWLEVSLIIPATQQSVVEAMLEDLGALSVTLHDADAETPDEQAIFEPGVGETPLWKTLALDALFAHDAEPDRLLARLVAALPELSAQQIGLREIEDQDWERAWMDRFQPMRFGRRLWIYPWNIEPPRDEAAVIVRLDPGLAFGTGTHPTTALCLEWLDSLELAGSSVIDYGCGSGLLAIAALKLGAARATGVDTDPQALSATNANAARNDVAQRLTLHLPDALPDAKVDVLVANILAGPLLELAPRFAALCRADARLALSGILTGQQEELLRRYEPWFGALEVRERDNWLRISGIRKQDP